MTVRFVFHATRDEVADFSAVRLVERLWPDAANTDAYNYEVMSMTSSRYDWHHDEGYGY